MSRRGRGTWRRAMLGGLAASSAVGFAALAWLGRPVQGPRSNAATIVWARLTPREGMTVDSAFRYELLLGWDVNTGAPPMVNVEVHPDLNAEIRRPAWSVTIDPEPDIGDRESWRMRSAGTIRFDPPLPPGTPVRIGFGAEYTPATAGMPGVATSRQGDMRYVTVHIR